MVFCAWLKRLLCRRLLPLILCLYFFIILLLLMNLDFTDPRSRTEESFSLIFPEPTFNTKRQSLLENNNLSSHGHINQISKIILRASDPRFDVQSVQSVFDLSGNRKIDIKYSEPVPLNEPMIDREFRMEKGGDFVCVGEGAYIYSAFLDDRKEQSFVRVMALMTQKASKMFIYCHFNDSNNVKPTKSELYELCENHNKYYGGYIYSCEIPNDISKTELKSLLISFTKTGPKINVYLRSVRPPESKLSYLNLYPQSSYLSDISKTSNENVKLNVPFTLGNARHSSTPSKGLPSHQPLSFAICVPPLFGNISLHRLVEFVELSRLLGAQHFIFYNHSVPQEVSNALKHYMKKNIASVLPWSLPAEVDSVWYYGQLLANNDCLYRTMPHFDLVSFNDLDEFIVPHSTASTWGETFSSMLTRDRCGFSFQSAFYDPGIREQFESSLLTPILTAKSEMYSKVRTKVMLCPWRVYEVGIHHISKQNREEWRSWSVQPDVAYLHHYRRCVANFGMRCGVWQKDFIIAERYLNNLTANYERELSSILFSVENMKLR